MLQGDDMGPGPRVLVGTSVVPPELECYLWETEGRMTARASEPQDQTIVLQIPQAPEHCSRGPPQASIRFAVKVAMATRI